MAFISPVPKLYFTDNNGNPLVGGKLWTYESGTTTLATTYTTFEGDTENTNPIILDSRGECVAFLDSTQIYTFYLTDENDVAIWNAPVDGINGNSATSNNILQNIPTAEWAAIKNGTSTYDCTTGIQTTIDNLNALYNGGTYGGGAGTAYAPGGTYPYTGIVRKKGVHLEGDGAVNTVFKLTGASTTGMKCPAAGTMLAADVVSGLITRGINFISGEAAPVAQIQWNLIGFTYCSWYDCDVEWFGGCSGITMLNSTLAGSGGPAEWYNNFYNLNLTRLASRPAGGIAGQLGDTDITKEQITTWNFRGGRVSGAGSGTGLMIRGTGNMLDGVVFEAMTTALEFGSTGTRGATGNTCIGLYFEGNTINRRFRANAVNTVNIGGFITGGTDDDLSDTTYFIEPGHYLAHIPNAAGNSWEVTMAGTARRPTFRGTTAPGIVLVNDANGYSEIVNASTGSASWSWLQFTGNASQLMFEAGQSGLRPGADNTMSCGSSGVRWSVIYAATGAINTSDANEKTDGRGMTAKEKAVAQAIKTEGPSVYKMKDSIYEKGAHARLHVGYMAQNIRDHFIKGGLDPYAYGINCIDQMPDGSVRLGLRYDELRCFLDGA
jgi:hypothetical protein